MQQAVASPRVRRRTDNESLDREDEEHGDLVVIGLTNDLFYDQDDVNFIQKLSFLVSKASKVYPKLEGLTGAGVHMLKRKKGSFPPSLREFAWRYYNDRALLNNVRYIINPSDPYSISDSEIMQEIAWKSGTTEDGGFPGRFFNRPEITIMDWWEYWKEKLLLPDDLREVLEAYKEHKCDMAPSE